MSRKLVSAKELAKELKVNLMTVYRAEEKGEITNYGIGRAKRYDLNEVFRVES
jgi:DNA-binding transcriptional regulator YhcF (GntR family)